MENLKYADITDAAIASAKVMQAYMLRSPILIDTLTGRPVPSEGVMLKDLLPPRYMIPAFRNGVQVANPLTDGPTETWATVAVDLDGLFYFEWPEWGDASLLAAMPAGGSVDASISSRGISGKPATKALGQTKITPGDKNKMTTEVFGSPSVKALVSLDGTMWRAETPAHEAWARGRSKTEVI